MSFLVGMIMVTLVVVSFTFAATRQPTPSNTTSASVTEAVIVQPITGRVHYRSRAGRRITGEILSITNDNHRQLMYVLRRRGHQRSQSFRRPANEVFPVHSVA